MADRMIKGLINGNVNVYALDAREMVEQARQTHDTWPVCTAALGRALMATAMMAAMLQHEEGRLSVTIKGGGPAGSIVTVGRPGGLVKGYIDQPHVDLPPNAKGKLDVGGAVGSDGRLTVVKDLGLGEPYSGSVRLVSGEIAEDFTAYFAISEQQPAAIHLGVTVRGAGEVVAASGYMLMPLPGCPDSLIHALEQAVAAAPPMSDALAAGESVEEYMRRAFGSGGLEFIVSQHLTPAFCCDCSTERIERVLVSLGREELEDMLEKDKGTDVTCHFCGKTYAFSHAELADLVQQALPGSPARQ